jgi:hypothetical protein
MTRPPIPTFDRTIEMSPQIAEMQRVMAQDTTTDQETKDTIFRLACLVEGFKAYSEALVEYIETYMPE